MECYRRVTNRLKLDYNGSKLVLMMVKVIKVTKRRRKFGENGVLFANCADFQRDYSDVKTEDCGWRMFRVITEVQREVALPLWSYWVGVGGVTTRL
jgi:hypothetical protein